MKKTLLFLSAILMAAIATPRLLPNYGGERAGLSTLSFLKNDMSPRSVGIGRHQCSLVEMPIR